MIHFAQNIYILTLMKAIGQLLKTQKTTVKRAIKKNTKGGKRVGSGRKKAEMTCNLIVSFIEQLNQIV